MIDSGGNGVVGQTRTDKENAARAETVGTTRLYNVQLGEQLYLMGRDKTKPGACGWTRLD